MKDMKAISPIISIIILLLITIAIAGAGFSYISVYWTGLMSKQIEILPPYCTSNRAVITLRNIGTSEINNSDHEAMLGLFEQDESTVGMWHFDESDGNASLDSSGQGNTGSIFGNTVLLMHFDEDGNATLDSTSYGNTGTLYGNTVLLMHFDEGSGNPEDSTSYGNHGDISGHEPAWKASGCQSGSCLEFDGDGDYVDAGNDESLQLNNSQMTVELWFKLSHSIPDGGDGNQYYLLRKDDCFIDEISIGGIGNMYAGGGDEIHADGYIELPGGGTGRWEIGYNTSGWDTNWHHLVVTYDATEGKPNIYLDGKNKSIDIYATDTGTFVNTADSSLYIGVHVHTGQEDWGNFFNGSIDEVAIYSKALSQEEVETLYEAGRAKFIERKPGKSGNGIEFDGDGDYVDATKIGVWNNIFDDDKNFTIVAWVKPASITHSSIVGQRYGDAMVFGLRNTGKLFLNMDDTRGNSPESTDALTTDNWQHIAVVFADYRNATFYINGSFSGSGTADDAISTQSYLFVGWQSRTDAGFPKYFNGTIDEVAIYSRALTGDEINVSYQAGKAKFIEHVTGRFGNAMEFDGENNGSFIPDVDNDFINIGNQAQLNFGSSTNFSIFLWFKSPDLSGRPRNVLVGKKDYTGSGVGYQINVISSGKIAVAFNDGGGANYLYSDSTGYDDDVWHQISLIVDRTNLSKMWIDGNLQSNTLNVSGIGNLSNSDNFKIGDQDVSGYNAFKGTIDEVLIFNRSLSVEEIQAQLKPACSCSGNTCQCGELTVTRILGQGYFHPYFDNGTFSPGKSLTMTDYNCLSERCEYRITSPTGSYEATVVCS